MCIRDSIEEVQENKEQIEISKFYERLPNTAIIATHEFLNGCLLYTSDAADERSSVDLGGRRIIKKKNRQKSGVGRMMRTIRKI